MPRKNHPPEPELTADELQAIAVHQENLRVALDTLKTLVNELAYTVIDKGNTGLDATLIAEDLQTKASEFLDLLQGED